MTKTPQDHYDDGQRDAAEDRGYNPPHDLLENITTWSREGCERIAEDNGAYRDGYKDSDSQKK